MQTSRHGQNRAVTDPQNITVDLLVVGSGTGMSAALAAHELGMSTLIVEKTAYVGGSTARSGGAFWLPGSSILADAGSADTPDKARTYLETLVGDDARAGGHPRYEAERVSAVANRQIRFIQGSDATNLDVGHCLPSAV